MFGKKKQPPIRSLIAHGSKISGEIKFSDGMRIDGEVHGSIRSNEGSPSILVISETAVVKGEVYADHVIVNGRVEGPLYAAVLLELQPKARIAGDVRYAALEMHQGAVIEGQLHALTTAAEKTVLTLAANNR
ncbi:bactofilin family protein [Variovorax sp. HJSM1_2]|uniref:bactofilin family protein n=1 Tax=Variovorax sp. HJSM1_2 TaxID=3366263 RepID=UPI003BD499DB